MLLLMIMFARRPQATTTDVDSGGVCGRTRTPKVAYAAYRTGKTSFNHREGVSEIDLKSGPHPPRTRV
jgi:hypothetical protein